MTVNLSEISRFRWLIVWLADNFVSEDIQKARTLLKDKLGPRHEEIGDDALKLFDALEKENLIHDEDTQLLRVLLEGLERMDLLEDLDEYERARKAVIRRLNKNASLLEGPFFGYSDIIETIVGILEEEFEHIHCLCISGMPGTGKTRLAKEACLRLREYRKVIVVDLRELPTIESIFFAIMHAFDIESRDFEPNNLFAFLRNYDCKEHGGAIIFLDNVDQPLDPGSSELPNPMYMQFKSFLENITNLPNPRLKVLMTSRLGVKKTDLNLKVIHSFRLDEHNELDFNAAIDMFRYHAGKTSVEDEEVKKLVNLCGKNPLALKVVASRLQDGSISPKDMVSFLSADAGPQLGNVMRALSHLGLAKDDQMAFCLRNSVESLPANHRRNIIKLSVIPGSFTLDAARNILDYRKRDIESLQLDLQTLKYRSLLESEKDEDMYQTSTKGLRYHMHLLLRSFIIQLVEISGGELAAIYKEAKRSYLSYYGKRLRRLTKRLQEDFVSALAKLNEDRANYIRFLEMLKTSTDMPEEFQAPETVWWVYLAVELIYFTEDRLKFYRLLAIEAKNRGDMLGYANSTSYEIMQLLDLGHDADSLLQKLAEIEDVINNHVTKGASKSMSLATCYYVRGDILSRYQPQQRAAEAIPWLEKAVDIRRNILGGESGNHLLIARALNSLGTAVQTKAVLDPGPSIVHIKSEKKKAMKYFQEAYNMCCRLTHGSDKHLDIPTYVMNIGTCYHEMDKYEEAIEYYQKALRLEQELRMDGSEKTCLTLKNIAMSYYELDRFEDAIPIAKRAMEGRQKILGQYHPQTARSVYFVGSLYLSAENYREARRFLDEALKIEEELWRRGKPHSSDWSRLRNRIEKLMITLHKNYKKRFREAENEANKGKPKLDLDDDQESSTSSSDYSSGKKRRASTSSSETSSENTSTVDQSQQRESHKMLQLPDVDLRDASDSRRSRSDGLEDTDDSSSRTSGSIPSGISIEFPPPVDDDDEHEQEHGDMFETR
ncbi:uncharacterized protein [Amphiura filiformis]|uniref:uncharacterized protein isoform X2 n=1 Tax=Amphiura filiformis TaxID=82378 RepID=UPI003B2239BD